MAKDIKAALDKNMLLVAEMGEKARAQTDWPSSADIREEGMDEYTVVKEVQKGEWVFCLGEIKTSKKNYNEVVADWLFPEGDTLLAPVDEHKSIVNFLNLVYCVLTRVLRRFFILNMPELFLKSA